MSLLSGDSVANAASGLGYLPISRQIGIFIGLAASIALGVAVILWAKEPNFRPLFTQLTPKDTSSVVESLQQAGIEYKINNQTGGVMVPGNDVYRARMALASEGLPRGDGKGFEMLQKSQGFGTSQFMERARYIHAMEGELARTINSFSSVRSARVHIALPRQSVFVRDRRKPSASVFLDLYSGRQLGSSQVDSIVHLVASSIPELSSEHVTVVDQKGNLLTDAGQNSSVSVADKQLKYTRTIEDGYVKKIEDLLTPILGPSKVKARVSADVDFTQTEQTKESYNPDFPALRSEQTMSESRADGSVGGGIPGALSNQATNPEDEQAGAGEGATRKDVQNERSQQTKNYELDKTISHTKQQVGRLQRLSVAVLVDDHTQTSRSGKVKRTPLSKEELTELTKLVREAIGFNPQRGDTVSVINRSFVAPQAIEKLPEPPMWKQAWFWDIAKQVMGGVFALFLLFGVIRPIFRSLAHKGADIQDLVSKHVELKKAEDEEPDKDALPAQLMNYDDQMRHVKNMAGDDPKRVAQVVKRWMDNE